MKAKNWLALSGLNMALAVGLGAFGAHGLKEALDAAQMATWQTAVQYHLVHGLALFALALWLHEEAPAWAGKVAMGLLLGMILFSGSLYAWVLTDQHFLVFITPIGGSVWLVTWLLLAWKAVQD
jgi:uncharacterized membrane protein YgdD (TMEM256/DUF423 family)